MNYVGKKCSKDLEGFFLSTAQGKLHVRKQAHLQRRIIKLMN